jgi:rSAM/selenodomain-associated transferase 1
MTENAADTRCTVVVFARVPEPGRVKTRLIPELGEAGAAALHRRLVGHSLAAATQAGIGPVELWCTPDSGDPFFEECRHRFGVSLHTQGEGDLGARMHRAFESALGRTRHALLAGSDIPAISAEYFREADRGLAAHDVVIGPAEDGGYVLIGLSRCHPELFRDIPWGGPGVLEATRRRVAALGWRPRELPSLWDVDRPEDLDRLPGEMRPV